MGSALTSHLQSAPHYCKPLPTQRDKAYCEFWRTQTVPVGGAVRSSKGKGNRSITCSPLADCLQSGTGQPR
eukprot:1234548-Pleurochrysis_carterae.AAC.1